MTSYLLAGPAVEPVSLGEAKGFLRLDEADEDALVSTLIGAARLHVEGVTGRALVAQSWRMVLDRWPENGMVKLPVSPLMSVTAISATDDNGVSHEIGLEQFGREPDRLLVPRAVVGMPALQERGGIEIDYVAGFGSEPEDVPADLRQTLLGLVAHWFEHRDAVIVAGSGTLVPSGFDRAVSAYKRVRL
jgi:uncharacterized phiE125 gp8 family phage protein